MKGTFFLIGHLFALLSSLGATELRFAKIFTDHGVLQRNMFVPVWGWAEPEVEVTVEFSGQKKKTCLLYTSPSPRDKRQSRMPSSA